MEKLRLSASVRRVVQLQRDETGAVVPTVLYRADRGKKKKGTRSAQPFEKAIRRLADAQARVSDTYLRRHKRANEKRKDGWLRDLVPNVTRAGDKGRKVLTKKGIRIVSPV
jgi:hypothetical protein